MPRPTTGAHTLCASLCNRNAHGHVTRAHYMRRFTGKMPQTKVARQTLCEHVTTSHFMLKSTGKKRRKPDWATWSSTGLEPYHEHPSQDTLFGESRKARAAEFMRASAVEMQKETSQHHFTREVSGKCRAPGPKQPFCASLRSWNVLGHATGAILRKNSQGKWRAPGPRQPFCASLHSRTACGQSQKPLYAGIYRKKAATARMKHPDQAPALTLTARTLSVDALFGE